MSILIKGMKMPTHCIDCPFMVSRDNDDCVLQSAESNESFENWEQMKAGCPLIELPPHGRLGDLDALRRAMYHEAFETDSPMQKWDSGCWIRYKLLERVEEAAPTIIPAEGGADG